MWFIEQPERWDLEQSELETLKICFQVDEDLKAQGFLRLYLELTSKSNLVEIPDEFLPLKLTVIFPSTYPFFRPMIYAEEIDLPRHQNKVDKNLCLLPRQTVFWLPETTLAEYLKEQLPKIFVEGMISDSKLLKEKADEQAEPISEYYPAVSNAPIIIDSSVFDNIETISQPVELLGYIMLGLPTEEKVPSRMLGLEYFNKEKKLIGRLPSNLDSLFRSTQLASIYRLEEPPPFGNIDEDFIWINKLLDQKKEKNHKFKHSIVLRNGNTINNVIGITFPEEHQPGETSWGWLFFVVGTVVSKERQGKKMIRESYKYYARINRVNAKELSFRIPSLKPLAEKTVAVFGLGALGAPSVIELAKNGIKKIKIIDFDIVDAGTTVRWPLGISVAGMFKTDALERFINNNYPYVEIQKYTYTVGAMEIKNEKITSDYLKSIISLKEILLDVSMIYDATAEVGINHFLSREAIKYNLPFLCIYGTHGIWGGVIMRSIPNVTGCWMCFQYGLHDHTYPVPPADQNASIQATGCGDLSFIGTSFELNNIVSSGIRLAIGTLCLNTDGYKDMGNDIGILSLVDENENPILPKWTSHQLKKHPECPYCNK